MESFFTYLAQNDELRFGLLFGSLTFAIILENLIPLVRFEHHRIKHIGTNLVFFGDIRHRDGCAYGHRLRCLRA